MQHLSCYFGRYFHPHRYDHHCQLWDGIPGDLGDEAWRRRDLKRLGASVGHDDIMNPLFKATVFSPGTDLVHLHTNGNSRRFPANTWRLATLTSIGSHCLPSQRKSVHIIICMVLIRQLSQTHCFAFGSVIIKTIMMNGQEKKEELVKGGSWLSGDLLTHIRHAVV